MAKEKSSTELDPGILSQANALLARATFRKFRVVAVDGPDSGKVYVAPSKECAIGSHPSNNLVLDDKTVSRFHCEIKIEDAMPRVRDLDSLNGTFVDGTQVVDGFLRNESIIRVGRTALRFELFEDRGNIRIASRSSFGSLVGDSVEMRAVFDILERAARTDSNLLIEGETGTGKDAAAESVHEESARSNAPFLALDCASVAGNLIESELFGHERGAFTGAQFRVGVFEAAHKGTVFLNEVGELPLELQPKLLRVLESRVVRRIGGTRDIPVDVRIIAASNHDLRTLVNEGRFRPDLYYRLSVLRGTMPPLRRHPTDIPGIARAIMSRLTSKEEADRLLTEELIARIQSAAWPGNVRQLRNYLEQCVVFPEPPPLAEVQGQVSAGISPPDPRLPYAESRRRALDEFERAYLIALLDEHAGNASKAARVAGMNRAYLYRLLHRHGLKR